MSFKKHVQCEREHKRECESEFYNNDYSNYFLSKKSIFGVLSGETLFKGERILNGYATLCVPHSE